MPYALWKGNKDMNSITKNGLCCLCEVVDISGLKGKNITIECSINNQRITHTVSAPSKIDIKIGQHLPIKYDSLDYKNLIVIWDSINYSP